MKSETVENTLQEQEARGKLRESFLKAVNILCGETCSIQTYEQSTLSGTFSGWKPNGSEVLINDLKTPANIKMASAILRTPDILAIQFDKPIELAL